ncbi:MAG: Asp-tRNA(Asn)/Glu-tRNA(Gln) amidotransferase subunit GatA [Peptoniphilus sp.]|nr:Asp-tRNA(Asn)/Glu-tRNA(Gln) amidotransferase subunit GatA [Peptoniphilus sp.]MDD7363110.1 Asp-tRNA(Asn)/Glu-tRNA(Gln) amidotransferase subunit GatA [Bacillota bacterium]MDY6044368.1 Asp-tRNA(Asn)/Glu-tRNA(Gln) amidotransferase subunit GatA [Peptoniphilus sp.]
MNLTQKTGLETRELFLNGEITCTELVEAYLENIKRDDEDLNVFVTVMEKEALEKAKELDEKRERGEALGKMAGIVVSIKDNIAVKDVLMTCSSKMLANFVSPYDAVVTRKLKDADAIIIGKVNMDEFAMGSSTKTSYFGVTKNPVDPTRVSGGSSGGSAASVAADFCAVSLGTDTGGSVRQPAAFCGLVGMKPSHGSISRYGVASMANTFDQVGVLAKSVDDVHYVLSILEGSDVRDATCIGNESLQLDKIDEAKPLGELKVAIPDIFKTFDVQDEVRGALENTMAYMKSQGAEVEFVNIESLDLAIAIYHILVNGEIAPNMSRYDGINYGYIAEDYSNIEELYVRTRSEGFGTEVKRRIMIGSYIMSMDHSKEYFDQSLKMRHCMIEEFNNVFETHDIILCPTSPTVAVPIARDMTPVQTYMLDLFTVPVNLIGTGGISVPVRFEDSLPVGVQIIPKKSNDHQALRTAKELEGNI